MTLKLLIGIITVTTLFFNIVHCADVEIKDAKLKRQLLSISKSKDKANKVFSDAKEKHEVTMSKLKADTVKAYEGAMKRATKSGDIRTATSLMKTVDEMKEDEVPSSPKTSSLESTQSVGAVFFASCDGEFIVYLNGEVLFSGSGRGKKSNPFHIKKNDIISVSLKKTDLKNYGFAAWIVSNDVAIVPDWKISKEKDPKKIKKEGSSKATKGFDRVAFQGYFKTVEPIQKVSSKSVWSGSKDGIIVWKFKK